MADLGWRQDPRRHVADHDRGGAGGRAVRDVLGSGKVVLIAVPGAFTPTCSDHHLPGFVLRAEDLAAKGVETVACVSVNDAFVMGAWGQAQGADGKVIMLADGNGEFAAAMGLEMDGSGFGLGTRSQRYAAVIEDGVVTELHGRAGPRPRGQLGRRGARQALTRHPGGDVACLADGRGRRTDPSDRVRRPGGERGRAAPAACPSADRR